MFAYDVAKAAHRGQVREADAGLSEKEARYFNHPKRMAIAMMIAGIRDANVICACLLHDCPEDTGLFGNQFTDGYHQAMEQARFRLTRAFNAKVAAYVIALTIPYKNELVFELSTKTKCLALYHKNLSTECPEVLAGKLFDRLDNIATIEVKKREIALLKLKETEEFYIPLFERNFKPKISVTQKVCYKKLKELQELVARKKEQLKS